MNFNKFEEFFYHNDSSKIITSAEGREIGLGSQIEYRKKLTVAQNNGCENALTPISFVNGPPGTGKTKTLTAIVENCLHRGGGVLVIAETNFAVNNLYQSVKQNTIATDDLHIIVLENT